tara:strand:+ start:1093 stop:1299 length:207 start_codon:yes stop_codon:yes gene_type:complete
MPLPGSHRNKKLIQEIVEPEQQSTVEGMYNPKPMVSPEFLQEIKEPTHEETLVEEKPKKRRKKFLGVL